MMLWRPLARAARGSVSVSTRAATSTSRPFYSRAARSLTSPSSAVTQIVSPFSSTSSPARRVLCVDVDDAACVQTLVQRGHLVDKLQQPSHAQLLEVVGDYDALLVSPTTSVSRELLARGAAAKLALIAVASDAIDSTCIDTTEATALGVLLLQLDKKQIGDKFSVEAEHALTLVLQLVRHLPASIAAARAVSSSSSSSSPLKREAFTGTELYNKSLGIVGLGQAGKCVVEMARAMGLEVLGYDPNLTHEAASLMGVKRVSLDELYVQSDVLSFHAPLTGKTRGMFNAAALAQCKRGVTIVSVAEYHGRDGLLDLPTLVDGLDTGHIAGVGIDYLEDEGVESEAWQRLVSHDRVLTTRHLDAKSVTRAAAVSDAKKYRAIAENVSDALAQRYYRGVANGVFMPLTLVPEMQPFLQLSESLGKFLFDLVVTNDPKDPITKVTLATTGGVQVDITATKATSALQSAVVKGILDCISAKRSGAAATGFNGTKVSLLNASMLAMTQYGLDVRVGELSPTPRASTTHLNNSITVQVETRSHATFLVTGSVFGEEPRIVRINEYTDFPAFRPQGNLLLFKNQDKPGAIAGILKALADAQINIAHFGLARHASVELALGILALDAPVTAETMAKLQALPTVQNVQFARV